MASRSTTQTIQSSFSSPCSNPQPENDVFLNFRSEDTSNNFTDHLYRALEGKRIKTFKDDTKLEPGNPISLKLLDAIEKSRIAVVILSKNYASSTWCLEELVKILECKEEKGGLTVLPIFYHVEPKIVRHQKKTFAVALAEHENRFQKKKVQIWRNALSDVAKLSGKTLTDRPEGKFIQEIVDLILKILKDKHSIVYEDGFVGIDSRGVEEINSFLDMNSNDVRFIGICGKSGMGKTTLARFVFDKIRNQFEACSFLENVKEVSKAHGLETLQEQLLCDISKRALRVRDVCRGIQVIRNILRDKKVLVVVDDVSGKSHLEALVGKSWFGPRSRIIVTTEEEDLFKKYKIQSICKADGLNNDEAQRLFRHKAYCENDFLDLVNDFVTYAQGSPLVLKVLGSHLCKRTKEEWVSARNQLKAIPNENILEKLQIAYNGLEELEKKLFLHIACFFKGEDQNRVAAILESVCYSDDNIRKLIDKSLITIVGGKLCMHHLIQRMGWKIVCEESMDLGRRSRLWDCTHVLNVLKNNIGTDRIEGMELNLSSNDEQVELNAEPFSKMNKLKLLKICNLRLPCLSLSNLSNELLLLEWHEFPLESLPKSFQPLELVELIMHHSSIKQLPSEFSNLLKLKLIDLSDSQNLCQTPNFNGLPNIERLIFQGCTGLHALHPSVGSLNRLILLNLKDCKCLENLPHEINLKSLKILILSGCSKLKKFPKIGRNMTSMLELYLDRTAIEELPSSVKHLTSLTLLNLQDCENLSSFPSDICNLISLEILILSGCKGQPPKARYLSGLIPTLSSIGTTLTLPYTYLTDRQPEPELISLVLPESFSVLSSLESLDLSGCNMLDGALPDDLSYLSSLTSLNLRKNNFTRLPCSISQLLNLKLLFLDHCSKLQSLPYLPLSTQFVSAQGCTSLENYSNQVVVWTSDAARFTFINCHGLADDEGKIADVPLLNTHFQSLWQRYMEGQIHQLKGFCLVVPQTEISEWFDNKEYGPSVEIPLPPNLFNNRSWKGIALCVIFVVPPNLIDVSPGQDSKYFHAFICHFDIDGISLNCPVVLRVPKETFVGSFGLWLYISHARFTEHSDKGSCIGSVIRRTKSDIQIKMCGARILYEQDMTKFVQNSRPENFRSCDDLSRGHEKFIEDHMSSSQSSDTKLKQKLNSLLSTLYQVGWAQNHLYDYIFHQIARPPPWFACKKLGPSIEKQLPPDVHDNSKWLGFTIYALYGIQMQPVGFSYKLDLTIFLRSVDEVSLAPYTVFPFSRDVSDKSPQNSRRLVVFYIPRRVFQLNQCNHIGASFESGDTAVQFESCGIRLVHEQNVAEFVQALVEYMLGSPDSNHQSFYEHLSHQLGMLRVCNHEEDYPCPFLPERRPNPMRMLLRNNETIQEESTTWETFSNQVIAAGTSKNSSPGSLNLGISFGNGQCGSKMSGSRECWFKPCLQNHHKCSSAFNRCSPQSEIPKWFTEQIARSSMTISLPLNLYSKPDWIGFAISAVFSSHKNPTTACMKQGSGFSHMVLCHLKTNLGCMNPLLYYGIREEHVLTLLHQRKFLWESIISHRLLSSEWSECTWVEFSFVSDSSDLSALKCAVKLVYRDNLENFTLMAPCITLYNNPFTSNERSPFYLRDKSNDSDGLYEDQPNGTSGQYSYGGQHPRYQLYQTAVSDFFPSTPYICCFPPSKIQDWFSHQNHGCSAMMDLPSNLYHNSNWKGLVLYASFSIQGDSNFILSKLNSGNSHSLYCQCQMSMANVDDQTIAFSTSKEEITWLLELGEFIWISYIPGEPFKNMLQHCSRIEASFVSDWPGIIVQKCALQLLYQRDQIQFEQELKHCNNLISENRELVHKQQEDQKKRNEQYHADEGLQRKIFSNFDFEVKLFPRVIDQLETDETETKFGQSDLLENQGKVNKWRATSKKVTKISGEHLEKRRPTPVTKLLPSNETIQGECTSRGTIFSNQVIAAGTSKSSRYLGKISSSLECWINHEPVLQDFHPSTSYNFCFPPSKIHDWFSHLSHGHSVTIDLPSNLYHDSNWMGLVLYASFSIHGDPDIIFSNLVSRKSHFLFCQCQMSMDVDNQTIAFSTNKEEIKWLLNLGEFIWICYVPGEPFKNMLPHCSHIEASFVSDWPGVIVQKCALQLLYQHEQVQFEQELKHCNNLISQKWELVRKQLEDQKKINEQYHVDEGLQMKEKRSNDIEDDLVGISSRVEEMISYLDLESIDVHFIGICEKSGMGKTTLARAVFDKILNQFEACSFLENVRAESKAHGLKILQERLLCDIGKGGLRVKDEHKGMQVISDILHNKKALIVVDDVSERSQLEKLVGKRDLFGKGSRIIVTTEDKDLLASYEIKIVYKARGLNEVEALQLFSLNAFHKPHCENDFPEYCNNFVEYAQGIPLVLKVLGSCLCTRTKNEWESAQNQLRAIPHEKTTKKLRIAFDGLGAEEKKLFLDIACFFKGEEKNRVADILESVYFLEINLKNLIDKSLITLVRGEKLWMHNLLQQMGWEIVSEESEEARERSRLWHCDDVLDVLKKNTGTKHIEGMLLRLPPNEEVELNAESFSKMNKLRLLKICKVRLSCLSYLSNELRLLEWHDYPLESLPNSFQPGELVELIMHRSCLQQLPSEFSKLGKLKLIDLSDSQNLTRTPDFTGFSNIERLNFQGCTGLHELHPSVGGLKRLILLNLKDCKCLKNFPYELNLESLKTLILSGCSRFKKFPCIGGNMRSLLELYLDGTAIEELPPTIRHLTGLTLLNLQDCKNLKSFPSDIHSLKSLEILTLSGCKCQPPKAGHLLGLSPIGSSIGATLTFPRLISFLFLSFLAWRYTYLRIPIFATTALSIYCFHNARHPEPEPINLLLSNSFSKLSTLVTLSLSDCNLLALPDDPSCLLSIEYLNLSKNNFICLPDYISQLSKLKILFLDHCSKLKSLPYVPLSTRLVSVQGCTALENFSNQVVVWTLGVAGFTIITCLGLAEDEDGTIAEVSLLDIHLLWQRYVKDQIHQMEGFCHVLPQIEIPEWFKHQRFGSFRPIPLPSNLFSNKNWKGIALCVIFVVPAHSNDVSPGEDTKYFHEFYCRLDINGDLIAFKVPKETYVGSFGLWLYISHARFRKHLDERSCITPFIGTNSPDIEINMCGARILHKQDMGEFLQNLGQKIFGIRNDRRGELKSHSQLSRLYQSFSLDKSSGKKCYLLAARELSIEWGFTPEYWRWISLPEESRFPEVAELNRVYWFDIRGKMSTSLLSPKTCYAAYLVYKLRSGAHGFDGPPFKASVGTVGGEVYEQTVLLGRFVMEPNQRDQIIPPPQQHTSCPKQREDGWLEIELGQFFNGGGEDDELQIKLMEVEVLNEKTGLVVEGIEIRPTKGAGQDQ